MKYEYTGRHLEVTPAIKTHIENQFSRLDHLFENSSATAHIIINVEKGRHRSEFIVKWKDTVLAANSTVSDMYQSLSKTFEKIEKQALKLKDKDIDKHHKVKKIGLIEAEDDELDSEVKTPKIVPVKNYPIKPMTDEEAIIKLQEDTNQFVVFREATTQRISVIYTRKDGNYGLIQP